MLLLGVRQCPGGEKFLAEWLVQANTQVCDNKVLFNLTSAKMGFKGNKTSAVIPEVYL